ncbi:hypothetical protein [Hyalangium versicolor]|uniref:hypothetical protein n=1 Tax=Hyalangium versicolor TaxID=2861190 RepID=UPI001CCC7BDB|nr:hypothetical protein [Hyalangium versicolor]
MSNCNSRELPPFASLAEIVDPPPPPKDSPPGVKQDGKTDVPPQLQEKCAPESVEKQSTCNGRELPPLVSLAEIVDPPPPPRDSPPGVKQDGETDVPPQLQGNRSPDGAEKQSTAADE